MITRSQTHRKKTTFPFLSLPAELRCQIYTQILTLHELYNFMEHYFLQYESSNNGKGLRRISTECPAILLVNQQIYREARNELLDQNLIIFGLFPVNINSAISPCLVKDIRCIHFVVNIDEHYVPDFHLLHIFENLRMLHEIRKEHEDKEYIVKVSINCPIVAECVKGFLIEKKGFSVEIRGEAVIKLLLAAQL